MLDAPFVAMDVTWVFIRLCSSDEESTIIAWLACVLLPSKSITC